MQKEVKIINFKATRFGTFQALELDFEKFNNGVIAIKGNAGEGKSTIQNGIKTNVQGRNTLADQDQYGDAWELETQLLDGDRRIFVGAVKKEGETIDYRLYEKDDNGKKVSNPVIDGIKATPAKYMELIATELTFGIKDFLSEDATTHRKFMFKLFKPELEQLGVIFDKKHPDYEKSILGELDSLTYERDRLRSECTHKGAFMADFQRQGYEQRYLDLIEVKSLESLQNKRNELLVSKGKAEGNSKADFEKKKANIIARGQKITEQIRVLAEAKKSKYLKDLEDYRTIEKVNSEDERKINEAINLLESCSFTNHEEIHNTTAHYTDRWTKHFNGFEDKKPKEPICPVIENGVLKTVDTIIYDPDFLPLIDSAKFVRVEYTELELPRVDLSEFDKSIESIDEEISRAKANNDLFERYELNRKWVEADARVNQKRKELAVLYSGVDTGVPGLFMKPFFNKDGKQEIKTVYTGNYAPDFFKNDGSDERLLVGYSSTQRPIIGILLQVARLKRKGKALKYIFLDDVPMDKKSRKVVMDIALKNGLNIITSLTGDFDKGKLDQNELLIENGEVFFN